MQRVFIMLYVIFGFKFGIQFKRLCEMQCNLIKNCRVESVGLAKDFNLGMISSFCHVFTLNPQTQTIFDHQCFIISIAFKYILNNNLL